MLRLHVILLLALSILFIFSNTPQVHAQQTHPHLLVTTDQYSQLQSLASQEPWSGMKTRAIAECTQRTVTIPFSNNCNGSLNTINGTYPNLRSDTYCVRAIMGACSLAYILDAPNRQTYVNKIVQTMPAWEEILIHQSGANDGTPAWSTGYMTDASAAYFNTVLAVDVVYNELAQRTVPSDRASYPGLSPFDNEANYAEFILEQEFNHFYGSSKAVYNLLTKDGTTRSYNAAPHNYPPTKEAAMITYKLFKGTFSSSDNDSRALLFGGNLGGTNVVGYMPEMAARINSSGTYSEGPGYAYAGWGLDRDERSHLFDLLEFTGKDKEFDIDFYTNPQMQTFYEWLYGYASTPFGVMTSFSDTHAFRSLSVDGHGSNSWTTSSHIGQAGKFSQAAGSYAIWKTRNEPQQGRLLNYLLYTPNNADLRPPSRIYQNGGGFFLSQPVDDKALYGALWNAKEPEEGSPVFHARKDVNAIYLAAYGVPLLMNGGFCGAVDPSGPDGCSGVDRSGTRMYFSGSKYLGDRAVSNNIALTNYSNTTQLVTVTHGSLSHDEYQLINDDGIIQNFGAGITEGFTNNTFDYASANDGAFLSSANHDRNFILVHPTQNSHGYFLLIDEMSNISQGPAHLVFHPNSRRSNIITPLTEYDTFTCQDPSACGFERRLYSDSNAGLTLFFGTPPSNITLTPGIIASSNGGAIVEDYFFNSYPVANGNSNMVTVLFPFDSSHAKANMTRVAGSGYTGATITHSQSLIDTALESSSNTNVNQGNISFQGKAVFYRNQNNTLSNYFVRKGNHFSTSSSNPTGFDSQNPVTIYLHQTAGNIISPGTTVTFNYPGITGVGINNTLATPISSTTNSVTINVPAGTHALNLVTNGTPLPTLNPSSTPLPNTPTPEPSQANTPGDTNGDNQVTLQDYNIIISNFGRRSDNSQPLPRIQGDLDQNGVVDLQDYNQVISHFGVSN